MNNSEFDRDLKEKATSLYKEHYKLSKVDIVTEILHELEKLYKDYIDRDCKEETLKICKEYSAIINKNVYIVKENEKELVRCVDINKEGNLIVRDSNNKLKEIISGEVSIRGVKGYV